jgi:hypothetical protein
MTQRIDWFRVICELQRSGWTLASIGAQVGRSEGWVIHLNNSPDAQPRFDDGEALIALWAIATRRTAGAAPRMPEHRRRIATKYLRI